MRTSVKEAENNERVLTISPSGHGHWRIACTFKGRRYSTVTTNSVAVDHFNSERGEKYDGKNRVKMGYEDLVNEILRANGK